MTDFDTRIRTGLGHDEECGLCTVSALVLIRYAGGEAGSPADFSADSQFNASTDRSADFVRVDIIGDEIAELAAQLDAATYRLLTLLYEFDKRNGWHTGFRTCAHWLSWRTGMDLGAAREKVRVARALHQLPALSDVMRRGVLSYSKARALTRIATPANESDLLELAMHGTAAHIERIVRAWRTINGNEEADHERQRHEQRELSLLIDADGSYVLRGRLDPEAGALLQRALEMAREELYGRHAGRSVGRKVGLSAGGCTTQELADAMGLVAEIALQHGVADEAGLDDTNEPGSPISGKRAERFQIVVHVDHDAGMCEIGNGVRVSAETSRRLACDATRVTMTHDRNGTVLDVGRRTRTVPPALRRALEHRDRGCRFPGCGLRFCDAHHVTHWAAGGATSLNNLVLLCRFHHRLLHEDGYTMSFDGQRNIVFRDPKGECICDAPVPKPVRGDAAQRLRDHHHGEGLEIDEDTAPLWKGDRLDLDLAMLMLISTGTHEEVTAPGSIELQRSGESCRPPEFDQHSPYQR
ncbi:MAG: DUF222 domain-containing protein [Longimicrobiales bacterium]